MIGDKPLISGQTLGSALVNKPSARSELTQIFKVGQLLNARVIEPSSSGLLRLQAGSQTLSTPLQGSLFKIGDLLSLQVTALGGKPQLKILQGMTEQSQQTLQTLALRQLMPKQGTLDQLFQQLTPLLKAGSSLNQPLPQAVQELLQQVLPNEKLSPQAVKDLFRNSGLFFESNLLNSSQSGSDLKAALLKLVASLQSSSSQNTSLSQWLSAMGGREAVSRDPLALQERLLDALQKAAEGALAKLEIRQLHTLQQRDEGRLVWQLGLPIGQGDQVEEIDVAIKQQRRNAGSQEGGWSVDLHFDFDETGPMDVRLFLQDERVNAVFWATKAETLPKIEQLLPQLRSNLQRAGLEVEQLNAYRGQAPVAAQETPRPTGPLLDEKA